MNEWQPIETAPKDGTEILLHYRQWCGTTGLVVSGHWESQEGREFEATWAHSLGWGDADRWQPVPAPPPDTSPAPSE